MAPSMRYLVVRALLFLVPFTVLMIAQVPWWLSLIVSLAFAFAASIVFFGTLREEAAADLQRMREGRKQAGAGPDDADVEDAALEQEHDPHDAVRDRTGSEGDPLRTERDASDTERDGADAEPGRSDERDEPDASARP